MIAVKGADRRVRRDPGVRYAKALEAHERNETDLTRAQNRWQKSRALVRRLEKKLDREFNVRATHDLTPRAILDGDHDFNDDL